MAAINEAIDPAAPPTSPHSAACIQLMRRKITTTDTDTQENGQIFTVSRSTGELPT